jgi:hypothetical protein
MKPISFVYIMYEASKSTYAESYFIPLMQSLAQHGDSVLFIRVTEKNANDPISITNVSPHFALVHAPIGMFNYKNILSLKLLIRSPNADGVSCQRLIIGRGINTFWTCLVLGLLTQRKSGFVYDSDGLSADEAIEFRGSIKNSILYVPARMMEAILLWRADLVLTRSKATRAVLQKRMPLARNRSYLELNNGSNPLKYSELNFKGKTKTRKELGLSSTDAVFVYLGSYGPQYQFEKMLLVFSRIQTFGHEKKLLILVPPNDIEPVKRLVETYNIDPQSCIVRNAEHDQIPRLLAATDIGFSLRQESFSMKHVKPLKTREYLFSGMSVIYSKFTGDAARLPKEIGFVLEGTENDDLVDLQNWVQERMLKPQFFRNLGRKFALLNLSIDNDAYLLSGAIKKMLGRDDA